jgi:Protein of unknown function (DUF1360)
MEATLEVISAGAAGWMVATAAEPLQALKRRLGVGKEDLEDMMEHGGGALRMWIAKLLNCSLCSGFWAGLAMTGDFRMALLASLAAEAIARMENRI